MAYLKCHQCLHCAQDVGGAPSLAARQAEMLAETRTILHDLLSVDTINPVDVMNFFDRCELLDLLSGALKSF